VKYAITEDQILALRRRVNEILKEPKYQKMAELAEIEIV
jgi:hypothetical protein